MSPKNESENRDSGKVDKRKRIPKYQSKIDNPEKLATQGTHDEDKQSKNNPEKLATQGTHDEDKQSKNNPEKLATQGTHDEDKQSKNTAGIYVEHHYAQINTNYINKT